MYSFWIFFTHVFTRDPWELLGPPANTFRIHGQLKFQFPSTVLGPFENIFRRHERKPSPPTRRQKRPLLRRFKLEDRSSKCRLNVRSCGGSGRSSMLQGGFGKNPQLRAFTAAVAPHRGKLALSAHAAARQKVVGASICLLIYRRKPITWRGSNSIYKLVVFGFAQIHDTFRIGVLLLLSLSYPRWISAIHLYVVT